MKLSSNQFRTVSEIFGNISVAWFTAGIISPLFIQKTDFGWVIYLILGLIMFLFFSFGSLFFSGRVKNG